MFRCPNCGQSQKMKVSLPNNEEMTLYMDANTEQYAMVVGGALHPKSEEKGQFYKEQLLNTDASQLTQCHNCYDTHEIEVWIEAYKVPLKYFEMAELCHCGGELWMDQIPGSNKFGFVCEDCEWVKPNKVVSGAEA